MVPGSPRSAKLCDAQVTIQVRDVIDTDSLWTRVLTGTVIRAMAEALVVMNIYHRSDALVTFRLSLRQQGQVRYLGGGEKHGRCVGACGYAGTAADALRRI